MFVMLTATYPYNKTVEVVNAFIKQQETPPPAFMKILYVLATSSPSSAKVYALIEIEAGKEYEGLKEITKRQTYFINVEGYNYLAEVVLSAEEAIPLLGL